MSTTLTLQRGNPCSKAITVTNSSGLAYDLTAKTIFFTVKKETDNSSTDTGAVITKDISSHTNATGGVTTLALTASDTDVVPGDYLWDMRIYAGSPLVQLNTTSGACNIIEIITKRTS